MIRSLYSSLAFLPLAALAQTWSKCNPLYTTGCAADQGLANTHFASDFNTLSSLPSDWTATSSSASMACGTEGMQFTISAQGQSPTIATNFYFLFGTVTVMMRSAPGTGIVSSIVLESDTLDEIDWEWIGGDPSQVQTNYFGKGNTTSYDRAQYHTVAADTQSTMHNYTVDWREDGTDWYVDSVLIRSLSYYDAVGGTNYPQTPMKLKLGIWAGGDTSANNEGTVTWAGGATDFSQAPWSAYVQSVEIANRNPANSYSYGDATGSFGSIRMS